MCKHLLNITFVLFLIFNCTTCNQESRLPDWAVGTWEGLLGYEHGIEVYPIKVILNKTGKSQIEYLDQKCVFEIEITSISEHTINLNEKHSKHKCNPFGGGTIKLDRLDDFDLSLS